MEIAIQQNEFIVILVVIAIVSIIISFGCMYVIFRKAKINIFALRKTVSDLEEKIQEFESLILLLIEKKENIKSEIQELVNEEEKISIDVKEKKDQLDSISKELKIKSLEYEKEESEHKDILKKISNEFEELNLKTKELQELKKEASEIEKKISTWEEIRHLIEDDSKKLHTIQSKLDLYSRIDEFSEYGFFQKPDYLFETTERYVIEIERLRDKQKEFIKNKTVIIGPSDESFESGLSFIGKVLDAEKMLIIRAFNIECDLLISKVSQANFERTLQRISSLADSLEKHMADMRYGINNEYVALKMEECKLQYQNMVLKREEAEEQRAIREQIKEEQKARKEYEREMFIAEKDEQMFSTMLERAKKELSTASGEELQKAELRIKQLEMQLAEATSRAERAKSMAEQTKRGHVYIISNIGSFGDNVYKIGLTRRLDPTERVKELGDASVPFSFDIHAMIAADDAPALERALHVAFDNKRVNAVNMRKEFFRVSLEEIRSEIDSITKGQAHFIMTKKADEYYQTKRLQNPASA